MEKSHKVDDLECDKLLSKLYRTELKTFTLSFFSTAQQKYSVLGRLIIEVSRLHTIRHTHTHTYAHAE
jgi:hypothetical protein